MEEQNTPFVVHLRKMYIHLSQQLKLYGKYTFIGTSMNFIHNPHFCLIHMMSFAQQKNSHQGCVKWSIGLSK